MKKIGAKRNLLGILVSTLISIILIVLLMTNYFTHGFYSGTTNIEDIKKEDISYVELSDDGYEIQFKPESELLAGFDMIFSNIDNNNGIIVLEIKDVSGKTVDTLSVDTKLLANEKYYKFYLNNKLSENEVYTLKITAKDCDKNPELIFVNNYGENGEVIDSLLMGFGYAKYTFNIGEKILLSLVIVAIWLFLLTFLGKWKWLKKNGQFIVISILLVVLLAWNYEFNTFNGDNTTFDTFQADSESLVIGAIEAEKNGIYNRYGLGSYDSTSNKLDYYTSQYGLQGKVFIFIEKIMDYRITYDLLHFLCSFAAAITFLLIVIFIAKKYNRLMAGCFYFTFLLSPWIVNFARNLYWVEFTWFLPVLFGLICSCFINKKIVRVGCYIATYVSILIKCLCGYEYISTIMLATISFLLVDLVNSLILKDKLQLKRVFKSIIIMGIMCLLGFVSAIGIHAFLRGDGNIINGINSIIQNDLFKRTNGGNLNDFDVVYWPSLNASIWEVLCKYFHFNTSILSGISGNLFPLLALLPVIIFVYNYRLKKLDIKDLIFYIIFFLVSVSWYILAKSHSFIHTHMNYVLWYFGYVQICIYIIIKQIIKYFAKK